MADKIVSWGGFDSKGIDGMGVTGSLGILNSNTSSSVLLDIVGSTNNSFTFRSNPVLNSGQNGLKVNVSTAGYDNNGSHLAYNFQVGGTSYFTIANYGLATFAQSIETKTILLQYNPSNVTTLRVYSQGVAGNAIETGGSEGTVHLGSNTVNTKVNEILRITGKGTTSSTTALLVQNANASASFTVKDDQSIIINGSSSMTIPNSGSALTITRTGNYSNIGSQPLVNILDSTGGANVSKTGLYISTTGASANRAIEAYGGVGFGTVPLDNQFSVAYPINTSNTITATLSNNNYVLTLKSLTSFSSNAGTGISFWGDDRGQGGAISAFAGIRGVKENSTYLNSLGNLVFYVQTGSAGGQTETTYREAARFNSSGYFGIGTSTPSASLHISGASSNVLFEIDSPAVNNILYVSGSGRVGIGTGTPAYTLDTQGSGRFTSGVVVAAGQRVSLGGSDYGSDALYSVGGAPLDIKAYYYTRFTRENVNQGIQVIQVDGQALIKGSGTTSSTTALLVQNANASASLAVLDNGFVGIGTASPTTPLTINKPGSNNFFNFEPSATGTPPYLQAFYQGAVDARIYFDNSFKFRSGGSTIPYAIDAGAIQGTSLVSAGSAGSQGSLLLAGSSGNTSAVYFWEGGVSYRGALGFSGSSADFQIITNLPGPTTFSGNERFRIFGATGNVAIGTSTDSGGKLTVRGSGTTSSTTALLVQNANASASLTVTDDGSVIANTYLQFASNGSGGNYLFFNRNSNNNWTLGSNGVGDVLQIIGNTIYLKQDTIIQRSGLTVSPNINSPAPLTVNHTWNNASTVFSTLDINVTNTLSQTGSRLIDVSIANTSSFVLDANFNLGIKTSTPSASLHVSGTVLIDNILTLTPQDPLPTGVATGSFAVSSSVPPKPYFYDGTSWNALY